MHQTSKGLGLLLVEAPTFTVEQRKALEGLLDDPSATVRAALLAHFSRHGLESVAFLVEPRVAREAIVEDPDDNRVLECAVEGP